MNSQASINASHAHLEDLGQGLLRKLFCELLEFAQQHIPALLRAHLVHTSHDQLAQETAPELQA